jgi:hypothetical protein
MLGPEIKKTLETIKAEHGEEIIDPASAAFLGRKEEACTVKDLTQIQMLQYAYAVTTQQLEETVTLFNALVEEKNRVAGALAKMMQAQIAAREKAKNPKLVVPTIEMNRAQRRQHHR